MIKPGSQWVRNTFPHAQYTIGNEKIAVDLDAPEDVDRLGEIVLYHIRPRIIGVDPGYNYMYVSEIELRKGWWEVDGWPA